MMFSAICFTSLHIAYSHIYTHSLLFTFLAQKYFYYESKIPKEICSIKSNYNYNSVDSMYT